MIRRPPRSTRTDTLFPYTTLFRSRLGRDHDFTSKTGVIHSEVMLPEDAPERLHDRETLWNEVEAVEERKDAQLAREVEFAIRSEEHTSELQSLMRISYAVFCLKKKKHKRSQEHYKQ